ncbi:hypothetical protein ACX8XP_03380 [Calditrichota bacterium LG25]
MQLSLFSVENQSKELYRRNLSSFNLKQALRELELWQRTVDAPQDIPQKMEAVQFLAEELNRQKSNEMLFLAHLRQNYKNIKELQALKEDFRFLQKGLNKALAERLSERHYDFILENLHPAEVFFQEEEYKRAIEAVENYVSHFGEHVFLRQIEGAAYFKLGENTRGRTFYTLALFNDPRLCRIPYFVNRLIKNKLQFLQNKFDEWNLLAFQLTFALWEDGQLHIDEKNEEFESFIKKKVEEKAGEILDVQEAFLQFLHLLYLAEAERLRISSRNPSAYLLELQEEMQNVHFDWFLRYENALKKFYPI